MLIWNFPQVGQYVYQEERQERQECGHLEQEAASGGGKDTQVRVMLWHQLRVQGFIGIEINKSNLCVFPINGTKYQSPAVHRRGGVSWDIVTAMVRWL